MIIRGTALAGVYDIELDRHVDERGFFARIYCSDELAAAGIDFRSTQINISRNEVAYTLRGMHWQDPPFAEAKIVRAVAGSLYDVAVDIRPDSPTFHHWIGRTLDARRGNALLLPEEVAHGFLTLEPMTDVLYQMGRKHVTGHSRGFRYDDPKVAISWPVPPVKIGPADEQWPPL